jgi:hypothetical protein
MLKYTYHRRKLCTGVCSWYSSHPFNMELCCSISHVGPRQRLWDPAYWPHIGLLWIAVGVTLVAKEIGEVLMVHLGVIRAASEMGTL